MLSILWPPVPIHRNRADTLCSFVETPDFDRDSASTSLLRTREGRCRPQGTRLPQFRRGVASSLRTKRSNGEMTTGPTNDERPTWQSGTGHE